MTTSVHALGKKHYSNLNRNSREPWGYSTIQIVHVPDHSKKEQD